MNASWGSSCYSLKGAESLLLCWGRIAASLLPNRGLQHKQFTLFAQGHAGSSRASNGSQASCCSVQFFNPKVSKDGSEVFSSALKILQTGFFPFRFNRSHGDHQLSEAEQEGAIADQQQGSCTQKTNQEAFLSHYCYLNSVVLFWFAVKRHRKAAASIRPLDSSLQRFNFDI